MLMDLLFALRSLRRRSGFALLAAGLLALGVGSVVALFSVTYAVVLQPLPYKDPAQLLEISSTLLRAGSFPIYVSEPDYLSIKDGARGIEECAFFRPSLMAFWSPAGVKTISVAMTTANLFSVLGARPLVGTGIPATARDEAAVVSYTFWKASALGVSPVGRSIILNGKSFTVAGVMPRGFDFPGGNQVWITLPETRESLLRDARMGSVVARMRTTVPLVDVQRQLTEIANRLTQEFPATNKGFGFVAVPLSDSLLGSSSRSLLFLLLAATGLVLLIACADVAALLLGRSAERLEEVAVRQALGAPKGRLIRTLSMEGLVIAACAGCLGVGVAWLGIRMLRLTSVATLPRAGNAQISLPVLAFALLISLASVLVFSLLPILRASGVEPARLVKGGGWSAVQLGPRSRTGNALLVAGETSVALILLVGAALTLRSLQLLVRIDPGFQADGVLTFNVMLPESRYPNSADQALFFQRLLSRLRDMPRVEEAGASSGFTVGQETIRFSFPGQSGVSPFDLPVAEFQIITPSFFSALGVRILDGRDFEDADTSSTSTVAIINEALARQFWRGRDPVGQFVALAHGTGSRLPVRIVGVVRDTRDVSLTLAPRPEIYVPFAQFPVGGAAVFLRTSGPPSSLAGAAVTQLHSVDPDLPADFVMTLREYLSQSLATPRTIALLLGSFAALALVLAMGGIYGVVSYSVAQRTHEIGVRMALGASAHDVLGMLLWENLRSLLAGLAAGILAAIVLARSLDSFLYGIEPTNPLVFLIASSLLAAVSLLSCLVASHRSTKIHPAVALRHV